jgi:hypothetical protein
MRQLPTVNLEGTKFFVDIRLQEFRQVTDLNNSIPFSELVEENDRYILFFDTKEKNVFEGMALADNQTKNLKIVSIPSLWDLDPIGMENYLSEFQF